MKHIFVLNPVAGSQKAEKNILPHIIEEAKAAEVDYEVHRTINVGDAENYVKSRCQLFPEDNLRFYAIGGDGTLNEVANGAFGYSNAEIAFIPAGTGNDFARLFTNRQYFLDIKKQLEGGAQPIDLLKYGDRIIVNVINIGLDCAVVKKKEEIQSRFPFVGPLAYIAGIASVFAGNHGFPIKVTMEDGRVFHEEFTLVAVGNGAYYGGGFKGIPKAEINDGLLDVSLIRKINRRRFAALIGKYQKGTHLQAPLLKGVLTYEKCRSIIIEPEESMDICVDGEIYASGIINISVLPAAMNFSVPSGCSLR
ncbi:diacylglycerol kinase [Bacillota bacterium]